MVLYIPLCKCTRILLRQNSCILIQQEKVPNIFPIVTSSVSMQTIDNTIESIFNAEHPTISHTLPLANGHASLGSSLFVSYLSLPSHTILGFSTLRLRMHIRRVTPPPTSWSFFDITCNNNKKSLRTPIILAYFDSMQGIGTNIYFGTSFE